MAEWERWWSVPDELQHQELTELSTDAAGAGTEAADAPGDQFSTESDEDAVPQEPPGSTGPYAKGSSVRTVEEATKLLRGRDGEPQLFVQRIDLPGTDLDGLWRARAGQRVVGYYSTLEEARHALMLHRAKARGRIMCTDATATVMSPGTSGKRRRDTSAAGEDLSPDADPMRAVITECIRLLPEDRKRALEPAEVCTAEAVLAAAGLPPPKSMQGKWRARDGWRIVGYFSVLEEAQLALLQRLVRVRGGVPTDEVDGEAGPSCSGSSSSWLSAPSGAPSVGGAAAALAVPPPLPPPPVLWHICMQHLPADARAHLAKPHECTVQALAQALFASSLAPPPRKAPASCVAPLSRVCTADELMDAVLGGHWGREDGPLVCGSVRFPGLRLPGWTSVQALIAETTPAEQRLPGSLVSATHYVAANGKSKYENTTLQDVVRRFADRSRPHRLSVLQELGEYSQPGGPLAPPPFLQAMSLSRYYWSHPGFLLLSMAGSVTPYRCEPWGTASLHVVMWGCIVLLAAPCSSKNIKQFVQWLTDPEPNRGDFPKHLDSATLIVVRAGMSLLLPSGYMYTSFSASDACMVRWNLHTLAQLKPALALLNTLKKGLPNVQCVAMQMQQSRYFAWETFMHGLWAYVRDMARDSSEREHQRTPDEPRVRPLRAGQLTRQEEEGLHSLRRCLNNNMGSLGQAESARLLRFLEEQEGGATPVDEAGAVLSGGAAAHEMEVLT